MQTLCRVDSAKNDCKQDFDNCWMKRVELYGKIATGQYEAALPKIQKQFRDYLKHKCDYARQGPQASEEAYEVCFAVNLNQLATAITVIARQGYKDLSTLRSANLELAQVIEKKLLLHSDCAMRLGHPFMAVKIDFTSHCRGGARHRRLDDRKPLAH